MSRRIEQAGSFVASAAMSGASGTLGSPSSGIMCLATGAITVTMTNGGTVQITGATANAIYPLSVVSWSAGTGTFVALY